VSAAVIGAASPIPAMATIVVLTSHRALRNAVALLLGWSAVLVLLAVLVGALLGDSGPLVREDTKALLNLIVGLLLLSFALRNLIGARHPLAGPVAGEAPHSPAVPKWMHALDELRPGRAFGLGAVLLMVSPANIAVYLSALQGLKATETGVGELVLLVALIVAIDLCILIPLLVYVCMPRRAAHILGVGKTWLLDHQRAMMSWIFFAFGLLLVVSAVLDLA
jgi:threonine/homoserine/homoserine lactone efflux protein